MSVPARARCREERRASALVEDVTAKPQSSKAKSDTNGMRRAYVEVRLSE